MGEAAVAGAFAAIGGALAVLNAELDGSGPEVLLEADPLAGLAEGCLDILGGDAGVQAKVAGLVARATGTYADAARAAAPPNAPVQAMEMAIAAEIGCVLAISGRAAGALLAQAHALM
ncbi:endonuclease, partial [Pseudarthrobacter sp. NamE5]